MRSSPTLLMPRLSRDTHRDPRSPRAHQLPRLQIESTLGRHVLRICKTASLTFRKALRLLVELVLPKTYTNLCAGQTDWKVDVTTN